MTFATRISHIPRPVLGGFIAGSLAALTVVCVQLLGVGSRSSIAVAVLGFSAVLCIPSLLPKKVSESGGKTGDATEDAGRGR